MNQYFRRERAINDYNLDNEVWQQQITSLKTESKFFQKQMKE